MPDRFKGRERLACYISEEEEAPKPQNTDEVLFAWLQSSACCRAKKDEALDEVQIKLNSQQNSILGRLTKRIIVPPGFQSLLTPRYQKILVDYQGTADTHYQASPRARAPTAP